MTKSTIGKIIVFIVIGALMSTSLLAFLGMGFLGTELWSHVAFIIQIISRLVKMALADEIIKRLFWTIFAYLIFKFLIQTFVGIYQGVNTIRMRESAIKANRKYLGDVIENSKDKRELKKARKFDEANT